MKKLYMSPSMKAYKVKPANILTVSDTRIRTLMYSGSNNEEDGPYEAE